MSEQQHWWGGWTGQRRGVPGFRLNGADLVMGAGAFAMSAYLLFIDMPYAMMPGYAFVSFFIFCNVLRIARRYEIAWSLGMLATAIACSGLGLPSPMVWIVIVGEIMRAGLTWRAWHTRSLRGVMRKGDPA
jgi:hypothetical protein